MPLTIDLGVEIATFPAFDEPAEVAALVGAIDHVRVTNGLTPHQWTLRDLVELGVPMAVAEKYDRADELLLHLNQIHVSQAWDEH